MLLADTDEDKLNIFTLVQLLTFHNLTIYIAAGQELNPLKSSQNSNISVMQMAFHTHSSENYHRTQQTASTTLPSQSQTASHLVPAGQPASFAATSSKGGSFSVR